MAHTSGAINTILYYPITKVKNYLVAWALFNIKSTASNSSKDILEKPESLLRLQIIKFKIVRPRIISSIFCLRFSPHVFLAKTFIIFLTFFIMSHSTRKSHNCQELYLNKLLDKSQKIIYTWQVAGEGG